MHRRQWVNFEEHCTNDDIVIRRTAWASHKTDMTLGFGRQQIHNHTSWDLFRPVTYAHGFGPVASALMPCDNAHVFGEPPSTPVGTGNK